LVEESLQADLFSPSNVKLEALHRAIDGLRDRYGFEVIKTGRGLRDNESTRAHD